MTYDDIIDEWLASLDSDFVVGIEAEKLVAHVRETNPEALEDWLHGQAERLTALVITRHIHADRRSSRVRDFAERAEDFEEGDAEAFASFRVPYVIDSENTRRHVSDMTGADHAFVADAYTASGNRDLLLAAFHRAVAKKVGKKRTSDVFTEEQYDVLFQSITKPNAA